MNVKRLKEYLDKLDDNLEVVIKFAINPEDEIGHILNPFVVKNIMGRAVIYSDYETTEADCDFVGANYLLDTSNAVSKKTLRNKINELKQLWEE